MEIAANIVKYLFVGALGIEVLLIARAIFNLARDKARVSEPPVTTAGE